VSRGQRNGSPRPLISVFPTGASTFPSNLIIQCPNLLWLYSGLGHLVSFLILYTVGRTPWAADQTVARPLLTHRKIQIQNKLDSNPRPQCLSGRRQFMPWTERPLLSAYNSVVVLLNFLNTTPEVPRHLCLRDFFFFRSQLRLMPILLQ
jgi:hypothetical protein